MVAYVGVLAPNTWSWTAAMHSEENRCFQASTNQKSAFCAAREHGKPTGITNRRLALMWHLAVHMGSSERRWAPESDTLFRIHQIRSEHLTIYLPATNPVHKVPRITPVFVGSQRDPTSNDLCRDL